jgi:hypothetical protein
LLWNGLVCNCQGLIWNCYALLLDFGYCLSQLVSFSSWLIGHYAATADTCYADWYRHHGYVFDTVDLCFLCCGHSHLLTQLLCAQLLRIDNVLRTCCGLRTGIV